MVRPQAVSGMVRPQAVSGMVRPQAVLGMVRRRGIEGGAETLPYAHTELAIYDHDTVISRPVGSLSQVYGLY
jgi:hypothetical protein